MTLREYPDVEQGTPEWDDLRRGIVTGSTITGLITTRYLGAEGYGCAECGAEPHDPCRSKVKRAGASGAAIKTFHPARADLANARRVRVIEPARDLESRSIAVLLTAERITGYTEPTWIGDEMWRGIECEPRARDLYAEHYAAVTECGFMIRTIGPWMLGYSPDGLVGEDGLIEVKSRRQKKHLATILSGEVPAENMAQLQAGLLVSGREWIDYVSYCGGMPLWRKRVEPDPRWFEAITLAVEQFEQTAADMVRAYVAATEGLPATERVVEPEMSL